MVSNVQFLLTDCARQFDRPHLILEPYELPIYLNASTIAL